MRFVFLLSLSLGMMALATAAVAAADLPAVGKLKAVAEGAAQHGQAYSDSLMSLETKDHAIFISYPKSTECNLPYTVKYDEALVMTAQEKRNSPFKPLPESCLIVKQGKTSYLARFLLCKDKDVMGYEMTAGEGDPVTLGKFVPAAREDLLKRQYKNFQEADKGKNVAKTSAAAAAAVVAQKIGPVAMGLKDADAKVRIAALNAIGEKGRLVASIPLLKEMMKQVAVQKPEEQEALARALASLLATANGEMQVTAKLRNKYLADSAKEILQSTGGVIDGEDETAFVNLCRQDTLQTGERFSDEDHEALRAMLTRLTTHGKSSSTTIDIASEALAKFKTPMVAKRQDLDGPPTNARGRK